MKIVVPRSAFTTPSLRRKNSSEENKDKEEEKKRNKMEEEENDENLEDIHEKGSWLQVNLESFRYVIVSSTYPGQYVGQCTAVCHS